MGDSVESNELLNEYIINSKLFMDIGYIIKKQYEDNHKFLNLIRKNKKT